MRFAPCIAPAAICLWQKKKMLLFLFFFLTTASAVFSQDKSVTITGVVKDSAGLPMPNVTVTEKGKKHCIGYHE